MRYLWDQPTRASYQKWYGALYVGIRQRGSPFGVISSFPSVLRSTEGYPGSGLTDPFVQVTAIPPAASRPAGLRPGWAGYGERILDVDTNT